MSTDWKLSHLGIIVKDLQAAIEQVEKTGLGTAEDVIPMEMDGALVAKMCMVRIGPLQIEMFQHISGETMISEFLDAHGEGLHHMSFIVDDVDAELQRLTGNGAKLLWKKDVQNGKFFQQGKIAFLDPSPTVGPLLELEQIDLA